MGKTQKLCNILVMSNFAKERIKCKVGTLMTGPRQWPKIYSSTWLPSVLALELFLLSNKHFFDSLWKMPSHLPPSTSSKKKKKKLADYVKKNIKVNDSMGEKMGKPENISFG